MTLRPDEIVAIDAIIDRGLAEDVGSGDVTTLATVPEATQAHARLAAKERGVVAGLTVAERVFARLDGGVSIRWDVAEGESVEAGASVGTLVGPARAILTGERLALNLMQRMSGIATASRAMVEAARPATVLDTRKTAPGLRVIDKLAVRIGGARNHRVGLHDMILIKDNHIAAAGGIRPAIEAARSYRDDHPDELRIEVETRTLDEVRQAMDVGGFDWILLDNMVRLHDDGFVDVAPLRRAVDLVAGRAKTEASGNVTLATVGFIASTGVDYISSGALTHSVRALDLSLTIELD
jgi:nicotinate-nucleotide pyrophosphorylase (carboxylating)